jgi:hypothetical protein
VNLLQTIKKSKSSRMNKIPEVDELELEKTEEQPLVLLIKIQMRLKSEVILFSRPILFSILCHCTDVFSLSFLYKTYAFV